MFVPAVHDIQYFKYGIHDTHRLCLVSRYTLFLSGIQDTQY